MMKEPTFAKKGFSLYTKLTHVSSFKSLNRMIIYCYQIFCFFPKHHQRPKKSSTFFSQYNFFSPISFLWNHHGFRMPFSLLLKLLPHFFLYLSQFIPFFSCLCLGCDVFFSYYVLHSVGIASVLFFLLFFFFSTFSLTVLVKFNVDVINLLMMPV